MDNSKRRVRDELHAAGYLLPREVGQAVGLHQSTITHWARDGRIAGMQRFGNGKIQFIGIPKGELQRLLTEGIKVRRKAAPMRITPVAPVVQSMKGELERLGAVVMVTKLRGQLSALYAQYPNLKGEVQAQIAREGLAAKRRQ